MRTRDWLTTPLGAALVVALTACQASPTLPTSAPAARSTAPAEQAAAGSPQAAAVPFPESALAVKQASGSDHHLLSPVDPATGNAVAGYEPIDMGSSFSYTFSPDRKTMIFSSLAETSGSFASLHFLDLVTWTEATGLLLPTRGWSSAQAVSADGSRYAIATVDTRERQVWLVDAEKHVLLESIETPLYVTGMAFTSDAEGLMLYGNPENFDSGVTDGPPVAELRSAQDLDLIWSRGLDAVVDGFQPNAEFKGEAHQPGTGSTYRPAVAFDPESSTMYVVHADVDQLTRVEFARKRVLTQDIRSAASWFERLLALGAGVAHAKVQDGVEREAMLSQDGESLFIAGIENNMTQTSNGEWQFEQIPLPLQAIRPTTASVIWTSEAAGSSLQFSDDIGSLFISHFNLASEETETFEVSPADGAILNEASGMQMRLTHRMDGTPLLVAAEFGPVAPVTLSAFTLDGVPLGSWEVPRYGDWIMVP